MLLQNKEPFTPSDPCSLLSLLSPLLRLLLLLPPAASQQVVAYDFGIKHNILRRLASFGCSITVVPADYPADKVMGLNPDGVFFSNGPVSVASGA